MFQGVHPRLITEGFKIAHAETMKLLDTFSKKGAVDRDLLLDVVRTALRTKLNAELADHLTECVVDAILTIRKDENDDDPDLHMIEIQVRDACILLTMSVSKLSGDEGSPRSRSSCREASQPSHVVEKLPGRGLLDFVRAARPSEELLVLVSSSCWRGAARPSEELLVLVRSSSCW